VSGYLKLNAFWPFEAWSNLLRHELIIKASVLWKICSLCRLLDDASFYHFYFR